MGNAAVTGDVPGRRRLSSRSTEEEIEDFIENEVKRRKVVVWSKNYCTHCKTAIETLEKRCDDMKVYNLDEHKLGDNVQLVLGKMTGLSSVPNIFVNGKHIGGNRELQALKKSKKLKEMLKNGGESQ
jgi:glutaredoxin 3